MAKRYVGTARGVKLDMEALKKAHPNTVPVRNFKKSAAKTVAAKKQVGVNRTPRIKATIPAPRPIPVFEPINMKKTGQVVEVKSLVKEYVQEESKPKQKSKENLTNGDSV